MVAGSLDLKRSAVEEKALLGIDAYGPKADTRTVSIHYLTVLDDLYLQGVKLGIVDIPTCRAADRKPLIYGSLCGIQAIYGNRVPLGDYCVTVKNSRSYNSLRVRIIAVFNNSFYLYVPRVFSSCFICKEMDIVW